MDVAIVGAYVIRFTAMGKWIVVLVCRSLVSSSKSWMISMSVFFLSVVSSEILYSWSVMTGFIQNSRTNNIATLLRVSTAEFWMFIML